MLFLSLVLALNSPAAPRHYEPGSVSIAEAPTPAQAEVLRIQRHLETVERTLREEATSPLTPAQRAAREGVLDILHAYWVAGEFPKNKAFSDRRVPHFIDDEGTACAVGHLMLETGAEQMAREIAMYENYDFVADLDHPSVGAWLDEHGLTAEEAGWIQPSYGPCGPTGFAYVCGSDGNTYECEGIAVNCAGVEVVSEGACGAGGGGSSTGGEGTTSTGGGIDTALDTDGSTGGSSGGTTGGSTGGSTGDGDTDTGAGPGPDVIGPEICPAGETTGFSTGGPSETGDVDDTEGADPTDPGPGGSETGGDSAGASDDDEGGGCSVQGHRDAPVGAAALLVLGLFARRRRD